MIQLGSHVFYLKEKFKITTYNEISVYFSGNGQLIYANCSCATVICVTRPRVGLGYGFMTCKVRVRLVENGVTCSLVVRVTSYSQYCELDKMDVFPHEKNKPVDL